MATAQISADARDGEGSEFAVLLDLLGIDATDRVAICSQKPGGSFNGTVPICRADAEAVATSSPYVERRDVWFGVNPVELPAGHTGRGGDEHVSRCVALFADIDIKRGGVGGTEVANTVTKEISAALRQSPAAVVFSGHGGHAYWVLDPEDDGWTLDTAAKRIAAQAIYRRFHRLCVDIAASYGGSVDNVSQLSRILRVPGTFNRKEPDAPIRVKLHPWPFGTGGPLSVTEVAEALDAYGVPELAEDSARVGEVISPPEEWQFGTETDPYIAAMVTGWVTDTPASRHGWLVSQATRLACAHRIGLVSADDHGKAVAALDARFGLLLARHGEPRKPTPGEVAGALAWGMQRAAAMTDEQAAADIGMTQIGFGDGHIGVAASGGENTGSSLNLPAEFWAARSHLDHIRRFAWARMTPPDAVLNAVLAELSARIPPSVRIDTGILTPMPLHHYAGLVGPSGGFKSTSMSVAAKAVTFTNAWAGDAWELPEGLMVDPEYDCEGPYRWPLGSGQGIVEAFIGQKPVGTADAKGSRRTVRAQVRSNLLLSTDEGNDLVKACADPNSIVGEVLRALWAGKLAGQGNAKVENRRILHEGSYTLAVVAGFQEDVLARFFSTSALENGDPQRWVFAYSIAPEVPAEPVPDPGPLGVVVPGRMITLCDDLRERVRHEHWERLNGAARLSQMESQRPALLARAGALLAILDGRTVVSVDDWDLAEIMCDTSMRIARHAQDRRRRKVERGKAQEQADKVAEAVAITTATTGSPAERAAVRITSAIMTHGYLTDAGRHRVKWSGEKGIRVQVFNKNDRADADAGLALLVDSEQVAALTEGRTQYVELNA